VSSQFPNVALLPWMLDDYHQTKPNMKRLKYRIIVFFISILGLIVPIFKAKPVAVMITSQAFGALVLPVTVVCILFVGNKSKLMGEHKFSLFTNLALAAIFIFAVIMSYMSLSGIIATVKTL
jgi:Mn2+/Fe2+ NRAMP family transporter